MSLFAAPRKAIGEGVALLTSDRKSTGLVLSMSVTANCLMAGERGAWRRPSAEREEARGLAELLHLRAASLDMDVGELSGGNQHKGGAGEVDSHAAVAVAAG